MKDWSNLTHEEFINLNRHLATSPLEEALIGRLEDAIQQLLSCAHYAPNCDRTHYEND